MRVTQGWIRPLTGCRTTRYFHSVQRSPGADRFKKHLILLMRADLGQGGQSAAEQCAGLWGAGASEAVGLWNRRRQSIESVKLPDITIGSLGTRLTGTHDIAHSIL